MPNHCYSSAQSIFDDQRGPVYYDWDWTVVWNREVYYEDRYMLSEVDTQEETDALLCDSTRTRESQLGTSITFNQGADIPNGVGLTTGGMLIFNSLYGGGSGTADTDLLEIQEFEEFTTTFDNCLAYIDSDNLLSVRSLSPCT